MAAANSSDKHDLSDYVDRLIDQKQYPDLTPEVRAEIKKDILERLDSFIMAKIIAEFSDEDLDAFETMLKEKKSQSELQEFAATHIPDFVTFLTNVLMEFQNIYLGTPRPTAQNTNDNLN